MAHIGYYQLRSCSDGPLGARPGATALGSVMASFYFEKDVAFLFPYINATAEQAEFHANPDLVRFVFEGVHCVVYPDRCIISPLADHEQVRSYVSRLIAFLEDIWQKKETIRPKNIRFKQEPVTKILSLLPKTNCGECGYKTCMAFAAMLSKQRVQPDGCPHLGRPVTLVYPVIDESGRQISSVSLHINGKDRDPVQTPAVPVQPDLPDPLSPRELEVLAMMGQGLTNREIGDDLHISPHTVKSHVVHIFNKLGVNHRTQAVVWAARHHII